MSLEEIASRYEELKIKLTEQQYNQEAGLVYDRELMKKLSKQLIEVSLKFLKKFKKPRRMYLSSIETIADAERVEIDLDLHDKRMEKISTEKYTIAGKKVNWGSWRQFNAQTDDPKKRKEVFDEFVSKALVVAPIVKKRMDIAKDVYKRYGLTPLDSYLEFEGIAYDNLRNLLMKLGDDARDFFLTAAEHFAPEILGKKKVEYYDDFYTWRGRIYRPLNKYFEKMNPLKEIERLLTKLGFAIDKIKVDSEDRENKSPSASCWGVQVPNDVRILFRRESPFSDFGSVFHEFGHGIHDVSANPKDSVWKRYLVARGVAETFSTLIESVLDTELFLRDDLKLERNTVNDVLDRKHFMNLAFLTFYAANSIMKLEFWKKNYTIEDAAKRWQELTKRFFIETPGNYWLLHHIMPNYDLYSPSYVIAAVRVAAIGERLAEDYGEKWWRNPKAGAFIRQLAQTRGEFDVKEWKLKPETYLEEQKVLSFL